MNWFSNLYIWTDWLMDQGMDNTEPLQFLFKLVQTSGDVVTTALKDNDGNGYGNGYGDGYGYGYGYGDGSGYGYGDGYGW